MYLFGTKIDLNNLMDLKLKNQANTNILNWGGKLLAYFEAGLPHKWVGDVCVRVCVNVCVCVSVCACLCVCVNVCTYMYL